MSFVPDLPLLIAYIGGVFVISITPGPDMTFFLGQTLSKGRLAGFCATLGATTGVLIHSILVAIGISALIKASPTIFFALKLAGALYLFWLAVSAIRHGTTFRIGKDRQKRSLSTIWMQGLAINLLNPKVVLFFLTFLPQFVSRNDVNATGKLLFLGVTFVILGFVISVPIILAASKLTSYMMQNPRVTRLIDWLFATVFSIFAVRILLASRI